jgi:hypothetical protein
VGRQWTDEQKKKLSLAKLGQPGRPHSLEEIEKIRIWNSGRKMSEEAKRKMSSSGRLKVFSEIHKRRIAETVRRAASTVEERERRRQAILGDLNPMKHSAHRSKLAKSLLGHTPNKGSGISQWSRYIRRDHQEIFVASSYELEVAKYLDEVEEEWEYVSRSKKHSFLLSTGQRYYPDFYLKRLDLYIDPKGYWRDGEKYELVEKEYPGRVRFLVGTSYLEELRILLDV